MQKLLLKSGCYRNATLTIPMVDNGSSSYCGVIKTLSQTAFNCSDIGANSVVLTVSDKYRNVSCNSTVTVVDNLAPRLSVKIYQSALMDQGQYQ